MCRCIDVLKASIDYLRYLEKCVGNLQAQKTSPRPPPPTSLQNCGQQEDDDDEDDEEMDDDEGETAVSTPATAALDHSGSMVSLPSLSQMTSGSTTSPSVFSTGAGRHYSISSTSQASYSPYVHSNQASPSFGPQLSHISAVSSAGPYRDTFSLSSPALKPLDSTQHLHNVAGRPPDLSEKRRPTSRAGRSEHELDQEATTALLMLNNDRRNWSGSRGNDASRSNTGMSVRDLLSG